MAEHGHFYCEELDVCPYNPSHSIIRSRMQTHLVKCKKSYPLAEKATCPFNATHLVDHPELCYHLSVCEDRKVLDNFKYTVGQSGLPDNVLPVENRNIPCDENWDDSDVPTYDPAHRLQDGSLLVQVKGATPSQREKFRQERRQMFQEQVGQLQDAPGLNGRVRRTDECGAQPFVRPDNAAVASTSNGGGAERMFREYQQDYGASTSKHGGGAPDFSFFFQEGALGRAKGFKNQPSTSGLGRQPFMNRMAAKFNKFNPVPDLSSTDVERTGLALKSIVLGSSGGRVEGSSWMGVNKEKTGAIPKRYGSRDPSCSHDQGVNDSPYVSDNYHSYQKNVGQNNDYQDYKSLRSESKGHVSFHQKFDDTPDKKSAVYSDSNEKDLEWFGDKNPYDNPDTDYNDHEEHGYPSGFDYNAGSDHLQTMKQNRRHEKRGPNHHQYQHEQVYGFSNKKSEGQREHDMRDNGRRAHYQEYDVRDYELPRAHDMRDYGRPADFRQHDMRDYERAPDFRQHDMRDYGRPADFRQHDMRDYGRPADFRQHDMRDYERAPDFRQHDVRDYERAPDFRQHDMRDNGRHAHYQEYDVRDYERAANYQEYDVRHYERPRAQDMRDYGRPADFRQHDMRDYGRPANNPEPDMRDYERAADYPEHDRDYECPADNREPDLRDYERPGDELEPDLRDYERPADKLEPDLGDYEGPGDKLAPDVRDYEHAADYPEHDRDYERAADKLEPDLGDYERAGDGSEPDMRDYNERHENHIKEYSEVEAPNRYDYSFKPKIPIDEAQVRISSFGRGMAGWFLGTSRDTKPGSSSNVKGPNTVTGWPALSERRPGSKKDWESRNYGMTGIGRGSRLQGDQEDQ